MPTASASCAARASARFPTRSWSMRCSAVVQPGRADLLAERRTPWLSPGRTPERRTPWLSPGRTPNVGHPGSRPVGCPSIAVLPSRRGTMKSVVAFVACLLSAVPVKAWAQADDYPARTVTFMCPFPAGGGTDILTRLLAQELQDKLKRPVIVENRPGAGTTIAARPVAEVEHEG